MNRILAIVLFIPLAASVSPVAAQEAAPEFTTEGLELVEKDRRGAVYADPKIDWSLYTEISLDRPTVAFRRNWQRDQNRYTFKVREDDVERIKTELADLFEEVFTEELTTKGGYAMSDGTGGNVMRLTPHIVDLDVYAPDTNTAFRTYSVTQTPGQMTLKLSLYDATTGDLIAAVSDKQEPPRTWMRWTTRVTNQAEFRRMLQHWAISLREQLDEARSG
jgi:hypothetical protein